MTTAIRGTTAERYSRILSVGAYRPERVVTNAEICAYTGLKEEWIELRSGIRTRRYAGADEPLPLMATTAAAKALAAAGIEGRQLGCVIAATITHMLQTPALAVDVAHRLGARDAAAFDVSAACAGFCHAVSLANTLVSTGQVDYVLVIGSERMTDILDHDDKDTAFIFADGAGAVVVGPSETPGIGPAVWRADGSRSGVLGMTDYWTPELKDDPDRWPVIQMSGWKVYRWATNELAPAAREILRLAGIGVEDLDAFIPHQANMLITDHLVQELGLAERTVVARDISEAGNTSAASIPLAMERMLSAGEVASGATALLLGFGAGLVFAGQVVRLP